MKGGNVRNTVRIIGGDFKRRQISFPDGEGLRPTPDRVRETLFNWLGQDLTGQYVLDLFAGSGALGFEAASRNAARVVLVEKAKPVHAALAASKALLKADRVELIHADALAWLARNNDRFDVVFLDPPYATDLLAQVLPLIAARLNDGGVVYAECASWPELDGWDVVREGKAGAVKHALLRRVA
ncbi:16S rRNA (guanine966-N2)-methyltransferase [Andreprevotia lacus DSM 23236]|jgi:16S rRNA (guanine966-N2)-methyltransferase|uniref:16S rRNA (Guanine966-N2)-methyltransferase n=1 Tax=Andreprevotia lacus DSM 23236 TaxID=1121001 RepID=A0A1W1XW75_9NEIS|nr:16S rRNA (guanine(966)-N(2))-methyltransferase RsmD [Andreprevotia lacus]SMC28112.1 16S rRNA (guanine966-N2)-methyltransferase [Andreprevotia lacus DSM 23236]